MARAQGHALDPGRLATFDRKLAPRAAENALFTVEGRPVGFVSWTRRGPLGLFVSILYLEGPEAVPSTYRALFLALERDRAPVAFVAGPLAGLARDAELRLMTGLGFARFGRSEMRFAFGTQVPEPRVPPGASLRTLGREDLESLVRLHAAAYRGRFDRYLFLEEEDEERDSEKALESIFAGRWGEVLAAGSWGLAIGGRLEGATLASRRPAGALILDVMVDPRRQGQGLGRAVLRAALRGLTAAGERSIHLNVTEGNERALGLYTSLGFSRSIGPSEDWYHPRRVPVAPGGSYSDPREGADAAAR